ncbi:hypothetical protein PENANT_c016G10619 [Penicillium antarcticum]|uniref:Uncharacterized protein n=1 Tax=Penicillium antarcticum TaxID=416450 RepID=A0A1V6Q2I3_9EURO|nr:hypothetical protein PENANT_c016G10619 [Penicillium antarcticum]
MQNLWPPQSHISQVLRLAIAKFSHTTTAIDHIGPLTWNHVSGNEDLVCIFEKIHNGDSVPIRLIQRVIRGNVILEEVNLTNLVQMAALRAKSDMNGSLPKFPFAAVVKLPCLAIKYPDGGNHIRRFQIKFTTEGDYNTALAILGEIGCLLTEGNTPVPRPTPSVSSWTSGHLSHAPTIMNPSTSIRSIGAPFHHIGTYGSERTTPLRASSPASTVSYAPCRFGPRQPTFNRPTQNIEPPVMAPFQSTHIPHAQYQEPEPSSSQLSIVSAIHNLDQLNQMLPPKRDLPFQKPPTKKPRSASVTRATENKPQPADLAKSQEQFRHSLHAVMQSEPSALDTGLPESQIQPPSQQAPYSEASQTSLADEDFVSQDIPSTRAIKHSAQKRSIQIASQADTNNVVNDTDAPAHTVPVMTEDHLAQYLAAPTPERVAFLENWMCGLIEDDRFMTLCQDVEGTWRRFAFGKKP